MLSKYVVRAQSPAPSVSSELGTIYLVCGEHNFELNFFFNCFLLFWEFLFGSGICNVLVAVFVIQELTEVIN